MQVDFANKLKKVLSNERLTAYQRQLLTNNNTGDLNLFSHYTWNIALSESLYPTLQLLEIGLRNTIHQAATSHFGQDNWFDNNQIINNGYEQRTIEKAKQSLQRQNKPLESCRIIAELNFGFWTSLLDRRYEQTLLHPIIRSAFPTMLRTQRTRQILSPRFNKIRRLRNRVFHHEPIWYWQDLAQQHEDILDAMMWIEPAIKDLATAVDRFPDVYQNGLAILDVELKQFC